MTDRLQDTAKSTTGRDDGSSLKHPFKAVKEFTKSKLPHKRGKSDGKGKKFNVINIVETMDVGVPLRLAYDQWTRFEDFPSFMKKVESVEQEAEEKLNWKAQVLWSHRTWESTILEQVPDKRIVWRSKGPKGWVDGAVTFHELEPELTRIAQAQLLQSARHAQQPGTVTEVPLDLPGHGRVRIGEETLPVAGVVAVDGLDQAKHGGLLHILNWLVVAGVPAGDRQMHPHQLGTDLLTARIV